MGSKSLSLRAISVRPRCSRMTLKVGGCVFSYVMDVEDEELLEAVQPTRPSGVPVGRDDDFKSWFHGMGTTTTRPARPVHARPARPARPVHARPTRPARPIHARPKGARYREPSHWKSQWKSQWKSERSTSGGRLREPTIDRCSTQQRKRFLQR